jgi:predicted phage-related endonuclease
MDLHTQSEAMSMGVYFERHIAKYAAAKLGIKVRAATRTIEYKGYPPVNLCATPDYYVLNSRMLMEVKLSSILYGWTEDDLHPHYEYQARAQMACTNRDVVIVAAMVGSTFYHVEVVRDLQKERRMLEAVDKFWYDHIIPGIRPVAEETQTRLRSAKVSRS